MSQPFIAFILVLICVSQFSEVTAQQATGGTGDPGSTTTDGNTYWVAAQLALKHGEREAAFTASDRACQEGTAIACSVAAEMIVQGQTEMGTPEQSVALFQKGCDLGNANACQGLGLMLVQGIGIKADAAKGRNIMQKACQANNAMACANLGLMIELGLFGPANHKEADLYFKRALVLQPNNEIALQAMSENSQTVHPGPSDSAPPKHASQATQTTELRGRLSTNPSPVAAFNSTHQFVPATCWDSVAAAWNAARETSPTKPTWTSAAASKLSDSQAIGLLILVASNPGAPAPNRVQTVAACKSHFDSELQRLLMQPWNIAPLSIAENTLVQVAPPIDAGDRKVPTDQSLLIIFDATDRGTGRPPQADKLFAFFRVKCDAGEVTPLFYFQTDRIGKLRPEISSPSTALLATVSDRARRLGCAPQSERRLWTQLSGLEAALSLRFEKDQQQTP